MSVCEEGVIGNTLQSDGTRILECVTVIDSGERSEFRQDYSSIHFIIITSHDQLSRVIIIELECTFTKLNSSQFRQVYSSFSLQSIHSQTLHENNCRMHNIQIEVISNWASLLVISFFHNHSQTQHENTSQMHKHHREAIVNVVSLFIISFFQNHSSIPMKHN